jgi:hypothetical protein
MFTASAGMQPAQAHGICACGHAPHPSQQNTAKIFQYQYKLQLLHFTLQLQSGRFHCFTPQGIKLNY